MNEIIENSWTRLRSFTNARLALGRTGDSLPTEEVLRFGLEHALARDAVHRSLDVESVVGGLAADGFESLTVQSAVRDRVEYLRRPDLGRTLNEESRAFLRTNSQRFLRDSDRIVIFIIADGLSAIAPERHALLILREMVARCEDLQRIPVIVATQARVALGDDIGEMLGAEMTVMLIGERPGLSAPDSLGIYLTYRPHIGCTDADRNCISNIRPEGLSYEAAAYKLNHLMLAARKLGRSGIALKDESDLQRLP